MLQRRYSNTPPHIPFLRSPSHDNTLRCIPYTLISFFSNLLLVYLAFRLRPYSASNTPGPFYIYCISESLSYPFSYCSYQRLRAYVICHFLFCSILSMHYFASFRLCFDWHFFPCIYPVLFCFLVLRIRSISLPSSELGISCLLFSIKLRRMVGIEHRTESVHYHNSSSSTICNIPTSI